MKTTLDLDDDLLARAKALAARERTSLTSLIEEGLRLRFDRVGAAGRPAASRLAVFQGAAGSPTASTRRPTARWLRLPTMTPDVNVLLAASRADHPHHAVAEPMAGERRRGREIGGSLSMLPMVLAGFLRLATHPKVFRSPRHPRLQLPSPTHCSQPGRGDRRPRPRVAGIASPGRSDRLPATTFPMPGLPQRC